MDWNKFKQENEDVCLDHRELHSIVPVPEPASVRGSEDSVRGGEQVGTVLDVVHPGAADPVTAAVSEPYVEPPLPEPTDDPHEIPAFLKRRADNGFMYPSLHLSGPQARVTGQPCEGERRAEELDPRWLMLHNMTDKQIMARAEKLSLLERQPLYEEMHRRNVSKRRLDKKGMTGANNPTSTD